MKHVQTSQMNPYLYHFFIRVLGTNFAIYLDQKKLHHRYVKNLMKIYYICFMDYLRMIQIKKNMLQRIMAFFL